MKIEDAVLAATADAGMLLSCLGQPVVTYHVTAIMTEPDARHADEMRRAFMRRSVEALVDDGLEDGAAKHLAAMLHNRVGSTWRLLHPIEGAPH
jgi:hypothetical protein